MDFFQSLVPYQGKFSEKIEGPKGNLLECVLLRSFFLSTFLPFEMPSRHATKKGKLNGASRKLINLSRSNADIDRAVLGTNEDTVFGRVTKMWGNGHCQVLAFCNGARVQLHKVRIPKNRLGKKGSTPITLSSTVSIFVGKTFEAAKVLDTDQFDITAVLDEKQVRQLMKQQLVPTWFLKSADEINSTEPSAVVEEEGFVWDTSDDEVAEDASVEIAVQAALAQKGKGKDIGHMGDALTKKQLREVKKTMEKISVGKKPTVVESGWEGFGTVEEEVPVASESVGKKSADAWIDRI